MKASRYSQISGVFNRIYLKAFFLSTVFGRKWFTVGFLQRELEYAKDEPLTAVQRRAIEEYWKGCKVNKGWFQFYNWTRPEKNTFDVRYVPDDLFYCCIYDYYNKTEEVKAIDDKNYYDLYFPDVKLPETVVHIIEGRCLDKNYKPVSLEAAIRMCEANDEIICKPSVRTAGGKGISFWKRGQDVSVLEEMLTNMGNAIVQEVVHQHPALDVLHKESINTIRIMTWYHDDEVEVISTIVRMGVGESRVDNVSNGGCYCGVNDDGSLKKWGHTEWGEPMLTHPQGAVFAECIIPSIDKCKEMVRLLSYRFIRVSKLSSWDLSVDEEGNPVLIEANLCNGALDLHQVANGPIFGDRGKEMVSTVLRQQKYRRFNRMIN